MQTAAKRELVEALRQLAKKHKTSDERELEAAAGCLYSLMAAIEANSAERLLNHTALFASTELKRLTAPRN